MQTYKPDNKAKKKEKEASAQLNTEIKPKDEN